MALPVLSGHLEHGVHPLCHIFIQLFNTPHGAENLVVVHLHTLMSGFQADEFFFEIQQLLLQFIGAALMGFKMLFNFLGDRISTRSTGWNDLRFFARHGL